MNFVIKQFLMDCNEEIEYTNYLEILPEEIITIIYRFVYDNNIKKLEYGGEGNISHNQKYNEKYPYDNLFLQHGFLPFAPNSYRSSNYYGTLPHQERLEICQPHTFLRHHHRNINLHQLKMMIMAEDYRREYTTLDATKPSRDFRQIYKNFHRYQYVDGFCFELLVIETTSSIYYNKFQFTLCYYNHNVGVIKIKSRSFSKNSTNKNAKVSFESPADFEKSKLYINHPQYYNDYKEPNRVIEPRQETHRQHNAPPLISINTNL